MTSYSARLRFFWASAASLRGMVLAQQPSCASADGPLPFTLQRKWRQSPDSYVLRFVLPRPYLGDDPSIPTCISVYHNGTSETGEGNALLKKSYSPISHPSTEGTVDLLVKSYPPRPGGGVGSHICGVEPGESILAKLKPRRMMHGSPDVRRRWDNLGLVAGGTGLAPLLQIVRIVLDDPEDETNVRLLTVNRREEDVLMRDELDRLASEHPHRFAVTHSLTSPPGAWDGLTGRGSVEMAREALPPPSSRGGGGNGEKTMVLVCGTDGFVETWAGPVCRGPPKEDGTKGKKIQGPLLGILKEAGYDSSEVFKY